MRRYLLFILALAFLAAGAEAEYDAVLVRSDMPLEWIIAQAYSHKSGLPIVTTSPSQLDSATKEQLSGYLLRGSKKVLIIGGEKAISLDIQRELDDMGLVTHRISEADRYGTSAQVAIELYGVSEGAVLASGENYAELLLAERIAAKTGYPILFIKQKEVPASVLDALGRIGAKKVFLVGSSSEVKSSLAGYSVLEVNSHEDVSAVREDYASYLYLLLGILLGAGAAAAYPRLKKSREKVPYTLLTEDEEKVVKAILASGGELTQDQLPELTSFSRPKISRVVADLSTRGLLSKEPHGRTQKLAVKKEFYEGAK